MPPTWNAGMLESWNNGQKRITSVFLYPMNRIIFQPDGTPMVPIFHHSIVPLFQLWAKRTKFRVSEIYSFISDLVFWSYRTAPFEPQLLNPIIQAISIKLIFNFCKLPIIGNIAKVQFSLSWTISYSSFHCGQRLPWCQMMDSKNFRQAFSSGNCSLSCSTFIISPPVFGEDITTPDCQIRTQRNLFFGYSSEKF